jgi:tetratricopeptide (TPR) repeat protein
MRYPLAMCLVRLQAFAEALQAIEDALNGNPPIEAPQMQELLFWKGVCEMQQEQGEAARGTFEKFLGLFPGGSETSSRYSQQFPAALKVPEARLLVGTCLLLEGRAGDAADHYARTKVNMVPVNRGRATVLQLHALLEAGKDDDAAKLVCDEFPRMGELTQLVTFQTLTFELGTRYLERTSRAKPSFAFSVSGVSIDFLSTNKPASKTSNETTSRERRPPRRSLRLTALWPDDGKGEARD